MLDTSDDLDQAQREIGHPVEQLFTPLTRFRPQRPDQHFAIDNGAFTEFRRDAFLALLDREKPRRHLCRFVTVPDVVSRESERSRDAIGSARRTLEVFDAWSRRLPGWPLALACQDGQEDLPIPWERLAAVFIAGSTQWKLSIHAAHIVKAAKALGVWVHIGRINTPDRWAHFEWLGADSCDGSGLARFSHMRDKIADTKTQRRLFAGEESA